MGDAADMAMDIEMGFADDAGIPYDLSDEDSKMITKPSPAIIEFFRRMAGRKTTNQFAITKRDMRKIVRLHDEQVEQIEFLKEQLRAYEDK